MRTFYRLSSPRIVFRVGTEFVDNDNDCDDNFHNFKEFCVDVSTYEPVEWVEEEAETCETVFVKVPIDYNHIYL